MSKVFDWASPQAILKMPDRLFFKYADFASSIDALRLADLIKIRHESYADKELIHKEIILPLKRLKFIEYFNMDKKIKKETEEKISFYNSSGRFD